MMEIVITSGAGEGATPLAAFDRALHQSGVANYNLIALSSIIPPNSEIIRRRYVTPPDDFGKRLYVVMARHHVEQRGDFAWAGIGWCQDSTTKKGLFVEHHGTNQRAVENDIWSSLQDMRAIRSETFDIQDYEMACIQCEGKPVCAVVLAVYKSERWEF